MKKNPLNFKNLLGQSVLLTVDTNQTWSNELPAKASLIEFLNPV